MVEWPVAVFLLLILFLQEVWGAGKTLAQVAGLIWTYSQRQRSPSREWTALIFSSLCLFCFALWESLLRLLLQSIGGWWLSLAGLIMMLVPIALRAQKIRQLPGRAWPMEAWQWAMGLAGFALLMHSVFSAVLLGLWVWWRARSVARSFAATH